MVASSEMISTATEQDPTITKTPTESGRTCPLSSKLIRISKSRTSCLFDVVGYSKLLVNEQREVVEQLNRIVHKTPQFRKSEAAGKLIRIPVGDGMALVFFQTPEEPVQCALEIAKACLRARLDIPEPL